MHQIHQPHQTFFYQKITDSKPHIWSLPFNFRSSSRKSQIHQKTVKKDDPFYNTVSLEKPHLFYESQLTQYGKKYTSTTQPKIHQLYKFSSKYVSGWCQKTICTTRFTEAQELHSRSTQNANVCIFLYITVSKFLFQRHKKLLSGGEIRVLNNFLKTAYCLGLVKCFKTFHLN